MANEKCCLPHNPVLIHLFQLFRHSSDSQRCSYACTCTSSRHALSRYNCCGTPWAILAKMDDETNDGIILSFKKDVLNLPHYISLCLKSARIAFKEMPIN